VKDALKKYLIPLTTRLFLPESVKRRGRVNQSGHIGMVDQAEER